MCEAGYHMHTPVVDNRVQLQIRSKYTGARAPTKSFDQGNVKDAKGQEIAVSEIGMSIGLWHFTSLTEIGLHGHCAGYETSRDSNSLKQGSHSSLWVGFCFIPVHEHCLRSLSFDFSVSLPLDITIVSTLQAFVRLPEPFGEIKGRDISACTFRDRLERAVDALCCSDFVVVTRMWVIVGYYLPVHPRDTCLADLIGPGLEIIDSSVGIQGGTIRATTRRGVEIARTPLLHHQLLTILLSFGDICLEPIRVVVTWGVGVNGENV